MPSKYSKPLEILYPPFLDMETNGYLAVNDGEISDPENANPIIEGEWLDLFSSAANTGKLQRAVGTTPLPFLYVDQKGRTDVQSTKKGNIALEAPLIIKTKIVNGTSLPAGSEVMVGTVTYNSKSKAGLLLATGGNYIVGKVLSVGTNTSHPDGSFWEILLYRQPVLKP